MSVSGASLALAARAALPRHRQVSALSSPVALESRDNARHGLLLRPVHQLSLDAQHAVPQLPELAIAARVRRAAALVVAPIHLENPHTITREHAVAAWSTRGIRSIGGNSLFAAS